MNHHYGYIYTIDYPSTSKQNETSPMQFPRHCRRKNASKSTPIPEKTPGPNSQKAPKRTDLEILLYGNDFQQMFSRCSSIFHIFPLEISVKPEEDSPETWGFPWDLPSPPAASPQVRDRITPSAAGPATPVSGQVTPVGQVRRGDVRWFGVHQWFLVCIDITIESP